MAGTYGVDRDIGPRPVFISDSKATKGKASVGGEEGPALYFLLPPRARPNDMMGMTEVLNFIDDHDTWRRAGTT
jgi:hypothetical protein